MQRVKHNKIKTIVCLKRNMMPCYIKFYKNLYKQFEMRRFLLSYTDVTRLHFQHFFSEAILRLIRTIPETPTIYFIKNITNTIQDFFQLNVSKATPTMVMLQIAIFIFD